MSQKRFTPEFKKQAAELVLDQDYTLREAAEAVDASYSAMKDWVRRLRSEREGVTPVRGKALTPEQRRIQELEAKIKRIEREKEILKKATTLLMSDTIKSSM